MTPERFFSNPPWAGGRGGIRMALRPIEAAGWLPDRITEAELAEKRRLLREHRDVVLRVLDASAPAQRLFADAVVAAAGAGAQAPPPSMPPIEAAALLVPDDLCLMQRSGDGYRLTAACVCAPSYWTLGDKIGLSLADIHARVPSVNDRIGPQMQRFFESLPAASVFERRNWSIHPTPVLFQPEYDGWARVTSFDQLFVRSERQTLRRLAVDSIAFTIQVTCLKLSDIEGYPQAAADLRLALERLDPVDRENMGYARFAEAVNALLRRANA